MERLTVQDHLLVDRPVQLVHALKALELTENKDEAQEIISIFKQPNE